MRLAVRLSVHCLSCYFIVLQYLVVVQAKNHPVIEPRFSGQARNLVPKGKINPITGHESPEGQETYSSTLS